MNPFHIEGPALLSISGGRTSAMLYRRVLDAHGGRLPADVHAVFCNTGKERPETLAFLAEMERRWDAPSTWLEWQAPAPSAPPIRTAVMHKRTGEVEEPLQTSLLGLAAPLRAAGVSTIEIETRAVQPTFVVVNHANAARNGEPFAALNAWKKFLPNVVARTCTQELKLMTCARYMASLGYDEWVNVIGLRADEPARIAKRHAENANDARPWVDRMPLDTAGIGKGAVMDFWAAQPFDLDLEWWESNCDLCYLMPPSTLIRRIRRRPESLAWWAEQERERGATFRKDASFEQLRVLADRPIVAGLGMEEDYERRPCACTD